MDPISALKSKGIEDDRIVEYQAAFQMFDVYNRGFFDENDLKELLSRFNQTFSDDDIRYMLRQFSDKATVDFVSFATSLHEKIGDSRYHEAFGDAFDLFDTGMRGELSADDLIDGMAKLGENLTSAEAEDMIKLAAKKDDFVKVMSQAALSNMGSGGGGHAPAPASSGPPGPGGGPPRPTGPPRPGAPGPGAAGTPAGTPRPGMPSGAPQAPRPNTPTGAPRPPGAPTGAPRPPGAPTGVPRPPGAPGVPRPPGA